MKTTRWKLVIAGTGMLLAGICAFSLFQRVPFDPKRVEPRLLSLQKPYRRIETEYYKDGGSIGMAIIDRDGTAEGFAIPNHMDPHHKNNGKVFVGATYDREPEAVEVQDSEQTKRMLIQVLAATRHRTRGDDFCLAALSRRWDDRLHVFVHSWIDQHL